MKEFSRVLASQESISKRGLVFGFGVNDSAYIISKYIDGKLTLCPAYSAWFRMIKRCYCKKSLIQHPTYKGCSVSHEWRYFSNFLSWYDKNYIDGFELDKDIKVIGNKEYSKERCIYVSKAVNRLLHKTNKKKSQLAMGVVKYNASGKYLARIGGQGAKNIGVFETEREAAEAYKREKNHLIDKAAEKNPEIAVHLLQHKHDI